MRSVSIFGCGWIGYSLAKKLEKSYKVKASVQSKSSFDTLEIKDKIILNALDKYKDKAFYESDIFVICIPPKGKYLDTLTTVLSYLNKDSQVILCSSTSVYTQAEGMVKEDDTEDIKEPSLMLQAERLVSRLCDDCLILRLGGLMGYERIAGKYTQGKLLDNDTYVNYIHKDDVVKIIQLCIHDNIRGQTYNCVAPAHNSKKEIYDKNALKYGFESTGFKSEIMKGKRVSSKKLIKELNYSFIKDEPLLFWD